MTQSLHHWRADPYHESLIEARWLGRSLPIRLQVGIHPKFRAMKTNTSQAELIHRMLRPKGAALRYYRPRTTRTMLVTDRKPRS